MSTDSIVNNEAENQGCISEFSWLGIGFVLPCASLTFYRLATRRKVISAILFFIIFTLGTSSLATLSVGKVMFNTGFDIRQTFETGDFPVITIRHGLAEVDAPQPLIISDEAGIAIIIDTSGQFTQLDRSHYTQGFLLTQTSLHILSRGRYQEIPLSEINEMLGENIIVINADTVSNFWSIFSLLLIFGVFLGLIIWNTAIRFMFISAIGVLLWGLVSIFRPNTSFGVILIAALYALVPAVYVDYLLGLIGINFIGLHTFLLLIFWVIVLIALLSKRRLEIDKRTQSLRGWRALIGIPMLITFTASVFFSWQYKALFVWLVFFLTFVLLAVVGYITKPKSLNSDESIS
jgi:hypothetical protein